MNEVSYLVAFSAGLLSFLSPCVLPLIPAYIGYLAGSSINEIKEHKVKTNVIPKALGFVAGFSMIFILMGVSATYIGKLLLANMLWLRKLAGILIFVFGLHILGIFKIKLFYRERKILKSNISEYSFNPVLMGIAFAAGWTPCVGPILSSILFYAGNMDTISKGFLLLVFYSLGLAVPFIFAAAAIDTFTKYIKKYSKIIPIVSVISGILLLILGILIFTNKMSILNDYFQFTYFY